MICEPVLLEVCEEYDIKGAEEGRAGIYCFVLDGVPYLLYVSSRFVRKVGIVYGSSCQLDHLGPVHELVFLKGVEVLYGTFGSVEASGYPVAEPY